MKLSSLLFLFCIAFFLFFVTVPLHELVHVAVDSIPGSGVKVVALNFFNERAYSAYSIASVSVMVYDPVAAQTTLLVGEILGFLVQFIIVAVVLAKVVLPHMQEANPSKGG